MDFAWDPSEARRNLAKHGVSFYEAKTVFDDDLFLVFADPDHSADENRFIIMGKSDQGHVLVVASRKDPMRSASSAPEKQRAESERPMPKKSNRRVDDELRPENDFQALRVVARGPGRKTPHEITVRLAPDVAQAFPDSDAVNEALRLLIRIAKGRPPRQKRART